MHGILTDIGISVLAATALGFIFQLLRQPVILGYLVAGALIGPAMGFNLVSEAASIEVISEIGLILLLFIIGLELNPNKLISSGCQLIIAGVGQFILCVVIGLGFFLLLGYELSNARIDALYLALF
jgi:Kef-type K+ transport system membrane component KefB